MKFKVGDEIENVSFVGSETVYPIGSKHRIKSISYDGPKIKLKITDDPNGMYFLPDEVELLTNRKMIKRSGTL